MWHVIYDRHYMYAKAYTSRFSSKNYLLAWLVYKWWALCYFMSVMPVKQLCLYQTKNGMPCLLGSRLMAENRHQLKKLKYKSNGLTKYRW